MHHILQLSIQQGLQLYLFRKGIHDPIKCITDGLLVGKKGSQVWSNLYSFLPRSRNILDYVEILEFSLVDRKLNSNSNDNSSDPDGLKNSFWCVDYYSPLCLQVFGTLWNLCSNDLWRRFVITIWQLVIEVQDLVAGKEC